MSNPLLTIDEAAELLRITRNRLGRMVRGGQVPHVKLPSGGVRFDERDIAAWLDANKTGGTSRPLAVEVVA